MRRTSAAAALIVAGALGLSACATAPASGPNLASSVPPSAPPDEAAPGARPTAPFVPARTRPLASLPGWSDEDHAAAFAAFQAGCAAARETAMARLCAEARAAGALAEEPARRFLETHLVAEASDEVGSLTAYFAPEYPARSQPDAEFSAPVRANPASTAPPAAVLAARTDDPIAAVLASADGQHAAGQPRVLTSADRRAIEVSPPNGALAWMRPEDLFFLQIQGSGTLTFSDGRRLKASYAGDNGKPFVAIARPMVEAGMLKPDQASGEAIRNWLAAHRGPEAQAVMWRNPRYIFFTLTPDDGVDPAGAAGAPLPPGRAIAIDPARHAYGEVFWIDAEAPILAGAFKTYRRLTVALDTGSAIRGQVRADLYLGRGEAAGLEAGRVRHSLKMMRLVPADTIRTARADTDEAAAQTR